MHSCRVGFMLTLGTINSQITRLLIIILNLKLNLGIIKLVGVFTFYKTGVFHLYCVCLFYYCII